MINKYGDNYSEIGIGKKDYDKSYKVFKFIIITAIICAAILTVLIVALVSWLT